MKKFEYKKIDRDLLENELNELGNKGWKLITRAIIVGVGVQYTYVFIREK